MLRFFDEETETTCVVGFGENAKVRPIKGKERYTTTVECVSATGAHCPSFLVAAARMIHQERSTDHLNNSGQRNAETSDRRMDNDAWYEWLHDLFLPSTKPSQPKEARLLVITSDNLPKTPEFLETCTEENVEVLILPPLSSPVLQPLYLSIFPLLKRSYHRQLDLFQSMSEDRQYSDIDLLAAYSFGQENLFTAINVRRGWSESGLWPVNVNKHLPNRRTAQDSGGNLNYSNYETTAPSGPDSYDILLCTTPKTSADVAMLTRQYEEAEGVKPPLRLHFEDMQKIFDDQSRLVAQLKRRISVLHKYIDTLQRSKGTD